MDPADISGQDMSVGPAAGPAAQQALFHSYQFTTNSLTYIASIARPCIFDSGASFHIVPGIYDMEGQHEWWWRENAAQAA